MILFLYFAVKQIQMLQVYQSRKDDQLMITDGNGGQLGTHVVFLNRRGKGRSAGYYGVDQHWKKLRRKPTDAEITMWNEESCNKFFNRSYPLSGNNRKKAESKNPAIKAKKKKK